MLMRIADVQLTFPSILTALLVDGVITAALPRTMRDALQIYVIIFAIGISLWPNFARTVRGSTWSSATRTTSWRRGSSACRPGASCSATSCPTSSVPVLVIGTLGLGLAIIAEATLSFLGVGLPPTQPSLGTLIRFGNDFLFSGQWWVTIFPGLDADPDGAVDQSAGRLAARRAEPEAALMPLLDVRDLIVEFPTRRGVLRALDGISFSIDSGRNPWRRRRVRRRKIADRRGDRRPAGTPRPHRRRRDPPGRTAHRQSAAGTAAPHPRPAHRHDLPGPADHAESALHHRPAVDRDDADPSAPDRCRGAAARDRLARPRRHSGRGPADRRLSARVLRRPAPARGDRAGACAPNPNW